MSKGIVSYLIVDNLETPPRLREGVIVRLFARRDSPRTREAAIDLVRSLWEEDRLPAERFANGITEESIMAVSEPTPNTDLLPVERGARELCHLLNLQVAHQQACHDARPLVSVVRAVLEEQRPLSPEELEIAGDRKTAKILQKVASTCAELTRCRESTSGDAKLVLDIIRADVEGDVQVVSPQDITNGAPKVKEKS
ncbi:hypothetical protein [Baaleninema simplex]|uniref:hypothetical protein n=1 Tax=Baaleninema simplex TaxID=2862350 RepID=UPI000345530A|nr:hypothetical protein [Baaleninema simplex]